MKNTKIFYGWYMVAIGFAMTFLTGSVAVSLFFKPMLEDFGFNRAQLSSVQSVALVIFVILSPFLGKLIDHFGPRVMIFATVATQVLSRVVNGVSGNIWHLYLARLLYGISVFPPTQVLINRWFIKKRGLALGLISSANPIGMMLLAPVTQYLILLWGWRPTMLFWALIALIIMLPLAFFVSNAPQEKKLAPDGKCQEDELSTKSSSLKQSTQGLIHITKTGLAMRQTLKTGSFWLLASSHFICGLGCGFMMTHIVIFATDFGYSDMIAASLLSIQGILCFIGILATGVLSDRMARKNVLSLTHFIRSLSYIISVIFIIRTGEQLWILYLAMIFFGFGWFTTAPLAAGLVADLFGNLNMGTIIGITMSCHMLGMAVSAYAGGLIYELMGSYYWAFLSLGFLEILAALFAFLIRRNR